jgi:methyl-accepting chemotaxis protein/methyl-accepting chemotaxis protein-1 (serine sensor receptor)
MQDQLVVEDVKQLNLAHGVSLDVEKLRSHQRGFIADSYAGHSEGQQENRQGFQKMRGQTEQKLAELHQLVDTDQERQSVERAQRILSQWVPIFEEITRLCSAGDVHGGDKLEDEKGTQLADAMEAASAEVIAGANESVARKDEETDRIRDRDMTMIMMAALLMVGTAGIGLWVVRSINLTLRRVAEHLNQRAAQVASSAAQVATSSQSLAQGSSEQAASLEETSASSEEIKAIAAQSSERTREAADLVAGSQQEFTKTSESLCEMVAAMDDINTQSGKISKIIKVIDEISFQTNILALNAAVEAARAGEAGMGFAVVADEVRSLAHRCARAAGDTSALIEESIAKSGEGKNKVDHMAQAIHSITGTSGKIRELVDHVNLSSQEQVRGIEQVTKAINQMEQVTQTTAANAEEGAAAAQELTAQSEGVREIVEKLVAMVGK